MTNKQKTIITTSGFFQWFFCGCEVTHIHSFELLPSKSGKKSLKYDDLTIIEGIGPVIKKLLNENNIHSFEELSQTELEKLKEILVQNSLQYHDPKTWPEQAKMASEGRWKELDKWQDILIGGKEK